LLVAGEATPHAPHRFAVPGVEHSIIIVDMPELKEVLKALADESSPILRRTSESREGSSSPNASGDVAAEQPLPKPEDLAGRSLPLLFIRAYDGVGYHSGRNIAIENVLNQYDLAKGAPPGVDGNWLAAATGATELGGWMIRVLWLRDEFNVVAIGRFACLSLLSA
jgi:recombining binding protein suppressor of hairless